MKTTWDLVYEAVQPFTSSARQTEIGTLLINRMYEPTAQVGIYCLHKDGNKLVIEIGTTQNEGMPMVKITL